MTAISKLLPPAPLLAVAAGAGLAGAADVDRGAYLVHAGGCIACHIGESESPNDLSGGRELASPFGIFVVPNITPDPATGIGGWSEEHFVRAMREGLSPEGDAYYPAFPYPYYAAVADDDLRDMKAYLDTLPAIHRENVPHRLPWYVNRVTMRIWQWLFFEPSPFDAAAYPDATLARGAYLVRHLGHCGACHTPRNALGVPEEELELAGNPMGPEDEVVPNITPHDETGIGKWSTLEIVWSLSDGMLPDGDFVGGSMSEVIDYNTAHLTDEDRAAIAAFLQWLPPRQGLEGEE